MHNFAFGDFGTGVDEKYFECLSSHQSALCTISLAYAAFHKIALYCASEYFFGDGDHYLGLVRRTEAEFEASGATVTPLAQQFCYRDSALENRAFRESISYKLRHYAGLIILL